MARRLPYPVPVGRRLPGKAPPGVREPGEDPVARVDLQTLQAAPTASQATVAAQSRSLVGFCIGYGFIMEVRRRLSAAYSRRDRWHLRNPGSSSSWTMSWSS